MTVASTERRDNELVRCRMRHPHEELRGESAEEKNRMMGQSVRGYGEGSRVSLAKELSRFWLRKSLQHWRMQSLWLSPVYAKRTIYAIDLRPHRMGMAATNIHQQQQQQQRQPTPRPQQLYYERCSNRSPNHRNCILF